MINKVIYTSIKSNIYHLFIDRLFILLNEAPVTLDTAYFLSRTLAMNKTAF